MFNQVGTYKVVITYALITAAKFCQDPGAFDVLIGVQGEQGEQGEWRGEYSNQPGRGNFSDRAQWQITLDTLKKIGLPGDDLYSFIQPDESGAASIPALVGKETTATVKASDKKQPDGSVRTYYNISYLGGQARPEGVNFAQFMAGIGRPVQPQQPAAPMPQQQQPAQFQQPAAAPGTFPNPFQNLKR